MLLILVKDLVEEEIKNGILPERVVSKYNSINSIIFYRI